MAYRVLEVTLVSANDLKKVSLFSRPRIYAVASISGFRVPSHSTEADQTNGCNPTWNAVAHFPIPAAADTRGLALHVRLRAKRVYLGDRDIGEVFVPIDDLLAGADKGGDLRPVSYQVRRPHSGRAHGVLHFCYKFTDVPATACVPVPEPEGKQGQHAKYVQDSENTTDKTMVPPTMYPPPHQYGSPYATYPPQPYAYAAPPPNGNNAATPQPAMYGYAAQPVVAPARHGGGMGMGLGLGLLGGAVGGMKLGEAIGDYEADAAYDAGFNDALAF